MSLALFLSELWSFKNWEEEEVEEEQEEEEEECPHRLLHWHPPTHTYIYLYLSIYLSIFLSIYLSIYQQTVHKGPRGIKDQSPIFYLPELIKDVKIGISRNALLYRIKIFMKFSNMYTFFRFDQWKVCPCTYKLKESGQENGLESNLGSQTSIFK